ncbi:hypothetical protein KMZ32_10120 [Phycicoccus sp. MAQZ13P-2]|uniref:hypothetical protein n=1 Tax=Phycicoccus mangrovi TaxID=2840470 RepID=UPI001C002867|nr:hypothetical protein [Phycicoccus mangrovi]MBT9255831.1 hypothetical protein [Phycicoccus mangrovi]MBT9274425.1 hypothetical protein [Phycicoccus mangrovi]
MASADLELRIALLRVGLVLGAVAEAGFLTWGAVAVPEHGWFAGVALAVLAVVLLVVGGRRRAASAGERGTWLLALGGLCVGATPFVAAVVGNAT